MDSARQPDAFSQTLDADLRRRSTTASDRTSTSERRSHGRIGSVNRLSKAFEHDDHAKPKLPAKPPSLRITPSAPPLRPPPTPLLPPHTAPVQASLAHNDNDAVDETPLAFSDIRARFQQNVSDAPPKPSLPQVRQTIRVAKPLIPPPSPRAKPPVSINDSRSGPLVSELSLRLEQHQLDTEQQHEHNEQRQQHGKRHQLQLPPDTYPSTTHGSHQISAKRLSNSSLPINSHTMLARSGTTSSIRSTTSTSSTSSTAATPSSKSNWHGYSLTSWLTGGSATDDPPQPLKKSITVIRQSTGESMSSQPKTISSSTSCTESLPVSPQLSGNGSSRSFKRSKVVQELLDTEKAYQSDMQLLQEIYYNPNRSNGSPFTELDIKVLFSNLLSILKLEERIVPILEVACRIAVNGSGNDEQDGTTVGSAFLKEMKTIECTYSEYCKKHDDAVLRLQELESRRDVQAYLAKCKERMQGRTTSWDLGSLLIKPVQRVLKYPLLLREIFMLTPAGHPDYENLSLATREIQQVADHINEIKRRKEIVEKIVGDKKKSEINVVHGINKKITRRAQRFKQATGFAAEATQDTTFNALNMQFERQQGVAQQLASDIEQWTRQVKEQFENLKLFADSAETLYDMYGGKKVRSMEQVRAWNRVAAYLATSLAGLDELQNGVHGRINDFLKNFENPTQVISKRAMKLLDYDRVRDIKAKGDVADKALQESADTYVSINAQLVEELPKFFELSTKYFNIVVGDVVLAKMRFYQQLYRKWQELADKYADPALKDDGTYDAVIAKYMLQMKSVMSLLDDIRPLNKAQWKTVPGTVSTPGEEFANGGLHVVPVHRRGSNLAQDGYFDSGVQSLANLNDEDTRSLASSRTYGSFRQTHKQRTATGYLVDVLTDDESSIATAPYEDKTPNESEFKCQVLYDFESNNAEFLRVRRGDKVCITDSSNEEWWYGCLGSQLGWLPANYCKKL